MRRYNYEYTYLRIWGGVITDATATPEDVISGQVFYNNTGRKTGTLDARRLKTSIYVVDSGKQDILDPRTLNVNHGSLYPMPQQAGRDNPKLYTARNTVYILRYNDFVPNSTGLMLHYGDPSTADSSSIQRTYEAIKKFYNLNIPISTLDNIQIGSMKYVIGSDRHSTNTADYYDNAYLIDTNLKAYRGTKDTLERLCVSFRCKTSETYPDLVLADIILSVSCDQYNSTRSRYIGLDSSIPIKISTYVDLTSTIL